MRRIIERYRQYIILIFAVGAVLFYVQNFDRFAQRLYNPDGENSRARGDLLSLSLAVVGGLGGIYTLYLNQRRVQAMEVGNVASRFKDAVALLGDNRQAISIGGAHSLQQIAEQHVEYRHTVFDIFCSYLREESKGLYPAEAAGLLSPSTKHLPYTDQEWETLKKVQCPEIVKVIFENLFKKGSIYKDDKPNLAGMVIFNVTFTDLVDVRGDFSNSSFVKVSFENVGFNNCTFADSIWRNCSFKRSTLYGSRFRTSFWDVCEFWESEIRQCDFRGDAHLFRCHFFNKSIVSECNFHRCTLEKCDFNDSSTTVKCIGSVPDGISGSYSKGLERCGRCCWSNCSQHLFL